MTFTCRLASLTEQHHCDLRCFSNFLLFLKLTTTYAARMTIIKMGLVNNWKYARAMTKTAIKGRATRSLVLGVKTSL